MMSKIKKYLELKFYYFCTSKFNFFYKKKIRFNYNFKKLKNLLDNRKILLLGNGKLKKKINYKKYDFIIRINIMPAYKKNSRTISKTNILMLQGSGGSHWILEKKVIKVWLHFGNAFVTNYAKCEIYHYPKLWELRLKKKLKGGWPTAGLKSLDFLIKILKKPKIHLYGFSFSPINTYIKMDKDEYDRQQKIHNYIGEKKIFHSIAKKYRYINIY